MTNKLVSTQFVLESLCNSISLIPSQEKCINKIIHELINEIIKRMKRKCRFFEDIYSTFNLCGSFRDKIKIAQPDEFDFNILFVLLKAIIVDDDESSETVRINLSNYNKDSADFKILRKWMDNKGFLRVQAIQSYFEGLLSKTEITKDPIKIAGHLLSIKIRKNGPAHTLYIEIVEATLGSTLQGFKLSVDIVPGVLVNPGRNDEWICIPKPKNGAGNHEHIEFVPSHPKQESDMIKDKQNMKNTLRLIKKVRDRKNVQCLKSYFLKSIFLWVNKRKAPEFWNKSLEELTEKMLEEIVQHLDDRQLLFYWRPKFNMLSKFSRSQIDTMRDQMNAALKQFRKHRNTIALCDVFLTEDEKKKLVMDMILKNKKIDVR